jgi:hypothetical protein
MTGQTMISAAFFVMLTIAVLSANKMVIESNKDYIQAQAIEQATNFANALISEILTKKFDANVTDPLHYYSSSEFESPNSLAPSQAAHDYVNPGGAPDVAPYKSIPGPNSNYFDDIDDYNGYERTANASDISGYQLRVIVYYVTKADPNAASSVRQYYKRIDVSVNHPLYLPNQLTFSAIATY